MSRHRHLEASFSQKRSDDALFPFHKFVQRIPNRFHFEPLPMLARRMYFNSRTDIAPTPFSPGHVGPPTLPSSLCNRLTTYEEITRADSSLLCGWSEILPEGFHHQLIDYPPNQYYQPPLHRLPFVHQNFPPKDVHQKCREEHHDVTQHEDVRDTSRRPFDTNFYSTEPRARNLVNSPIQQYILPHGHPEDSTCRCEFAHNCASLAGNSVPSEPVQKLSMAFNQPMCRSNKNLNFHIGHLNLNQTGLDNDIEMEHSMIIQCNLNHRAPLVDHFYKLAQDRNYRWIGERTITKTQLANIEIGVMRLDGSVERSLDKNKRDTMDDTAHPFLGKSPLFKETQANYIRHGLLGPPIGSPSQRWQ